MASPAGRFEAAVAAIDEANSGDPNTLVFEGVERPKEQLHAELMTGWVRRLDPTAGEAQLLAARAHHLRRWIVPRSDEPPGRAGYLRWRTKLRERHATEVAAILQGCGYDPATIERVQGIVRKQGLRTDPAVQTHEDALCLVFLQTQLGPLVEELGDDRAVEVLAKTAAKMSDAGREVALSLPLDPHDRELLLQAVAQL